MFKLCAKLLLFQGINYCYNDKPENDEEKSTEVIALWSKVRNNSHINFDDLGNNNLLEILDMDVSGEFPFILFILINRGDNTVDYEYINAKINNEVKYLVNLKDKKTGSKVLIVVVPMDNQTDWKEHSLSHIINIPNAFPTFALVCRQKQCRSCKNQKSMTLITIFSGVYLPQPQWIKDFLYKNQLKQSNKKVPLPYEDNQMGIISSILAHNFEKKNK